MCSVHSSTLSDDHEGQLDNDQFDDRDKRDEGRCYSLFFKLRNFSNEDFHRPGFRGGSKFAKLPYSDDDLIYFDFFANGTCDKNKGYVSVVIESNSTLSPHIQCDFSCVISVVDVHGNRRYSQSLAISPDSLLGNREVVDRFVARKTLLSEQSDLLPEDILNFCMDFYYTENIFETYYNESLAYNIRKYTPKFITEKTHPSEEFQPLESLRRNKRLFEFLRPNVDITQRVHAVVDLDSCVIQKLAEHSEFFQTLLRTEMREKKTGCIKLDHEEFSYLRFICLLLMGEFNIDIELSYLFSLYKTAHKYLIENALGMLREGMIHILCTDTFEMISEVAEVYDDDYLKKIIKEFQGETFYREDDCIEYPSYSITRRSTEYHQVLLYFNKIKEKQQVKQRDVRPDLDFLK